MRTLARDREAFAGRRVTVWGLGLFGGGVAAARYFARCGADVLVIDLKDADALAASVAALEDAGVRLGLGREHTEEDFAADLVVRSPAIPPGAAWIRHLTERGVPQTAEFTLGVERLAELGIPFAFVTGSKGKSTTSGLAGAMLGGAPSGVAVAGNNERPLLDVVFGGEAPPARLVLEVSSFMAHALGEAQAAGATLPAPEVLAFTSLCPEHLNWHGTVEAYYGAKLGLLGTRPQAVVFPAGDAELASRLGDGAGARAWEAVTTGDGGACRVEDGAVVWERGGAREVLFPQGALALLGPHNLQNALVAAATARLLGAAPAAIEAGARAFQPLAHRLETVAVAPDGVRFVNDSAATTPEAAIAALAAVPSPAVLLAGGAGKGADYGALGRAVAAAGATAICLGKVGGEVAAAVAAAGGAPVRVTGSFEEAFAEAVRRASPGGTVLLSPAAASYDMFTNFKARGERFRALAVEAAGRG